ncbi:hypothetical protein C5468_19170 [Photorhabdus luminescens subsp. mexicana]|uniref:Uncharacterized protein n=1 Tax=Photorhabdus luminescens subsp. mexicana TaxID=2100167 RepID=A0A4R4J3U3_PHOLU|nr:hypothetical protein C5468_19170 [Photorhabdus luminescens subsp. mexicana]
MKKYRKHLLNIIFLPPDEITRCLHFIQGGKSGFNRPTGHHQPRVDKFRSVTTFLHWQAGISLAPLPCVERYFLYVKKTETEK